MKKRQLVMLIIAIMLTALCSVTALAEETDVVESGTCGPDLTWTLYKNGELHITGTGKMNDYTYWSYTPWSKQQSKITTVVIDDGVTSVGNYAFNGCYNIAEVVAPATLETIGNYSFSDCTSLKNISLPDSLSSIGFSAFSDCKQLESIVLPDNTQVGASAFYNCSQLSSIELPRNMTVLSERMLSGCSNLQFVKLPDDVLSIENYAFDGNTGLKLVYIPLATTSIGNFAFRRCIGMESVFYAGSPEDWNLIKLGSDNKLLSTASRYYVKSKEDIRTLSVTDAEHGLFTLSSTCCVDGTTVSVQVFPDPGYQLKAIYVDGVAIEENKFLVSGNHVVSAEFEFYKEVVESGSCGASTYWCLYDDGELFIYGSGEMKYGTDYDHTSAPWRKYGNDITAVTVQDGVTSIGNGAFDQCTNLTSVYLPDSIQSLGSYSFTNCSMLKSIRIPSGITILPAYIFSGCDSLLSVVFLGNAPSFLGANQFPSSAAGKFVIYYHEETTGWTSPQWKGYYAACVEEVIDNYTALNDENKNAQGIVFTLNDTSNTAIVGTNSDEINNSGYYGIGGGSVVVPAVVIKGSKTYRVVGIGQNAFWGNYILNEISLGKNISSIASSAFVSCKTLREISVDEENIYYSAADGALYDKIQYQLYFYLGARGDAEYTVPASVKTIGANAFISCSGLKELTIHQNVTMIATESLKSCTGLERLTVPFIGGSASTSDALGTLFEIAYSVYRVPQSLNTVTVLGGKLNPRSFANFSGVKKIILQIPTGTTIPANCFYECTSLEVIQFEQETIPTPGKVTIPAGTESIGTSAFYGCESLNSVVFPESLVAINQTAFQKCTSLQVVNIPSGVKTIENLAFDMCTANTAFRVSEDNQNYCSDQWGVLYNKDKTVLFCYPSGRGWPYYNVANETVEISQKAFNNCTNLINLYIPNSVIKLKSDCLYRCPGTTICVYLGSSADTYATSNKLNSWYMDNYTLQGIEIYSLPEQTVFAMGAENLDGLYVTADYGGKSLQLDNYEISYSSAVSGLQKANIVYDGKSVSFDVLRYDAATETVINFGEITEAPNSLALIATYSRDSKMLSIQNALILNGTAKAILTKENYQNMDRAKLFQLSEGTFAPINNEMEIIKRQ